MRPLAKARIAQDSASIMSRNYALFFQIALMLGPHKVAEILQQVDRQELVDDNVVMSFENLARSKVSLLSDARDLVIRSGPCKSRPCHVKAVVEP